MAGDMRASSPGKDSPAGSNRNSSASIDSGRGFSTGHLDPKQAAHNFVNVQVNCQHRLSGQSYESGVSSRQSYHSTSSSSIGSLDRLDESGFSSQINVAELFQAGVPDHEVLLAWLRDFHFEDYYHNFLQAGYDMPTISRMTPEDLTAIGITKPGHRKRLKAEIARMNINDGIPDHKPNDLLNWLRLLKMEQYYTILHQQGYDTIDSVTDITWEDLEEIGIKKLGHQKKMMLAIDRVKRIISGAKRLSSIDTRRGSTELLEPPTAHNCRWSGEMAVPHNHVHHHDASLGYKSKHSSSSGDSLSTSSSGESRTCHQRDSDINGDLHHLQSLNGGQYQPDVVTIQVKRSRSQSSSSSGTPEAKDMSGQPITYQSFQVPSDRRISADYNDRESTPTGDDMNCGPRSPVTVAPVAPKVHVKPKPVAKIVAKTKRSSREYSPEIIDIEKHESEKTYEGGKSVRYYQGSGNGTLKRQNAVHTDSEHIYDQPQVQSAMSPPLVYPKTSIHHMHNHVEPVFVATQHPESMQQQPQGSPTGRSKKVPPPPPPKRTNSIRSDGHSMMPSIHENSNQNKSVTMATSQIAYVQPNHTTVTQHHNAPMVASQQHSMASHQHGMPSHHHSMTSHQQSMMSQHHGMTSQHHSMTSQQQSVVSPQQSVTSHQQGMVSHHQSASPQQHGIVHQQSQHQTTASPQQNMSPQQQSMASQQQSMASQQQNIVPQQQAFASCVQSLSVRFGSKREEAGTPDSPNSDGEDFPPPPPPVAMDIITPKILNYGIPSKSDKSAANSEFGLQNRVKREGSGSAGANGAATGGNVEHAFGVKLRKAPVSTPVTTSSGNTATTLSSEPQDKTGDNSKKEQISKVDASVRRNDSTASIDSMTSTSSVESNTLPFANENVGTIKQRAPVCKPSLMALVDSMEQHDDIPNPNPYSGVSGSARQTSTSSATASCRNQTTEATTCRKDVKKPPLPAKPAVAAQTGMSYGTQLAKQSEDQNCSGDVLNDIDTMLQGLTDELDAMLELEVME